MIQRILVWDAPTNVFHWVLAMSFMGAFLTANRSATAIFMWCLVTPSLGLIGFRLL